MKQAIGGFLLMGKRVACRGVSGKIHTHIILYFMKKSAIYKQINRYNYFDSFNYTGLQKDEQNVLYTYGERAWWAGGVLHLTSLNIPDNPM